MRDRLISLIDCATREYAEYSAEMYAECNYGIESMEEFIADYLLRSNTIVPPCKMGDVVYRVVTMGTGVTFKKVGYNTYREKEQTIKHFIRCVTVTKNNFFDVLENFGKTVFLTKEEAEQALKGGI